MTNTSREAVEALIGRLREKAQGKRNSVGDVWGDWICEDAASMLSSLLSRVVEAADMVERSHKAFMRENVARLAAEAEIAELRRALEQRMIHG